ncbi:MAG: hypothetical protein ACYCS1_05245 [Gammaproteobacteria bacterium]
MSHDNFNQYCLKCHRLSVSTYNGEEYYVDENGKFVDISELHEYDLPIKVRKFLFGEHGSCEDCNASTPPRLEAYGEWITITKIRPTKEHEKFLHEEAMKAAEKIKEDKIVRKKLYDELKQEFEKDEIE